MPESGDDRAFQRLAVVRSAKEQFFTEWFKNASDRLSLDKDAREKVETIVRETRDERERLESIMARWERIAEGEEMSRLKAEEVERLARVEFLQTTMMAKTAAAEALEKVAQITPTGIRESMLEVAAIDFRHANMMREELYKEYLQRPSPEDWAQVSGMQAGD